MDNLNQAVNKVVDYMHEHGFTKNYLSGVKSLADVAAMRTPLGEFAFDAIQTLPTIYERERALLILSQIELY